MPIPDDNRHIHPVIMPEPRRGRIRQVEEDVDALFLESERGHLGERRGIDPAHPRQQNSGAAPTDHGGRGPRSHRGGIAREQIRVNFEAGNVTNFEQWRARGYGARALSDHA